MSHATLAKWMADHRISLGCRNKCLLNSFNNMTQRKSFFLDNDNNVTFQDGSPAPNWGQETAYKYATKYANLGCATSIETPSGKDVNEDLCTRRYIIEEELKQGIREEDSLEMKGVILATCLENVFY